MRKYLGSYNPIYTPTFQDQISNISEGLIKRIKEKIEDLVYNPWRNTEFLKGKYRGKKKTRKQKNRFNKFMGDRYGVLFQTS